MELRTLRYFVAVLEAGSLSRAASSLYVAQPALTAQIKKLEQDLGTQLFERSHAGATPTASGGVGPPSHLGVDLFLKSAGIQATHVPYKGASEEYLQTFKHEISFTLEMMDMAGLKPM